MTKKYGGTEFISEKTEALYVALTKSGKQPPVVILQQVIFYIFILCLWLKIIRRPDLDV